jgi:hypothetical protein
MSFRYESPAWAAERVRQFATIKDLLTADTPAPLERLEIRIPSRLSTTNPQVTLRDLHRHRTSARGGAIADARGAPMRSRSSSFDQRRRPDRLRTAIAMAFFWPTRTTSRLPRVTPV